VLHINEKRFLNLMDEQARIGATGDGGLSRPALSEADLAVRQWFREQITAAGLQYRMDGAGNQSAIWTCDDPQAKTLLIGSHLDSVPAGGRFDGALGVMCAFEALLSLRDAGIRLPFHLEVISFTDEEGSLFGLLGSRAVAGQLTAADLAHPRGGRDSLETGMQRIGITEQMLLDASRDPQTLAGYLEVHIEQGRRLEQSGNQIGVVTSLVGMRNYWLHFIGEAAHAGAKPMLDRRDALVGALDFMQAARKVVLSDFLPGVVNFGQVMVQPGAFNIVPGEVHLALEFRHGTDDLIAQMEDRLLTLARDIAAQHALEFESMLVHAEPAGMMQETFITALETVAHNLNLTAQRMMSFALHDAQPMSQIAPAGMIFVPSVDGVSHNPKEFTRPQDCINGANVLLNAVEHLAQQTAV